MSNLVLYHGSHVVVSKPRIELCRPNNDHGRGFYCTESIELAKEWACQEGRDGFTNKYSIETEGLSVVDLNDSQFSILNWLTVLLENRLINILSPTMASASQWLKANYSVDLADADIVKGYRADDSYFGFARAFLRNEISLEQLSKAMRLGKLGEQYMIKSPAAFEAIKYQESQLADSSIYWPLREKRDIEARASFSKMVEIPANLNGNAFVGSSNKGSEGSEPHQQFYVIDLMRMRKEDADAFLQ